MANAWPTATTPPGPIPVDQLIELNTTFSVAPTIVTLSITTPDGLVTTYAPGGTQTYVLYYTVTHLACTSSAGGKWSSARAIPFSAGFDCSTCFCSDQPASVLVAAALISAYFDR